MFFNIVVQKHRETHLFQSLAMTLFPSSLLKKAFSPIWPPSSLASIPLYPNLISFQSKNTLGNSILKIFPDFNKGARQGKII